MKSLILPAAKILVWNFIGEDSLAKLDNVLLSNNTVKQRIKKMSGDISDQVIAGVKIRDLDLQYNLMNPQMSQTAVNCLSPSALHRTML